MNDMSHTKQGQADAEPVGLVLSREDLAVCRALIKDGSKSFYTASLLLPERVRAPSYAIYAFCRISDDAVDAPDAKANAVTELRARLDAAYQGTPRDDAVDRAFAGVVRRYDIPRALPEALLEGLEWDMQGRRYHTMSELYDYAARVAGAVGAMMSVLMGTRCPDTLARACDLGVAMQLTNIARDVGEDARNGRIYLPLDWLDEAGVDPEAWLANPELTPEIQALTARLLDDADHLYDRAVSGISRLPSACRPAIHAARLIYREIGKVVARNGYDSLSSRAVVSGSRKGQLVAAALGAMFVPSGPHSDPPLDETAFLVDAVPLDARSAGIGEGVHADWWEIDERAGRIVAMFGQLEARDKQGFRDNS
jgi:phytoene synthase